jgi:hypothetical protein
MFSKQTWQFWIGKVLTHSLAGMALERGAGSLNVLARVTRFGEFSPIGRLFTLGSFFNYST